MDCTWMKVKCRSCKQARNTLEELEQKAAAARTAYEAAMEEYGIALVYAEAELRRAEAEFCRVHAIFDDVAFHYHTVLAEARGELKK